MLVCIILIRRRDNEKSTKEVLLGLGVAACVLLFALYYFNRDHKFILYISVAGFFVALFFVVDWAEDKIKDKYPRPKQICVEQPHVPTTADEIKKYKDLLDSGAITEKEYEKKKSELLNKQ